MRSPPLWPELAADAAATLNTQSNQRLRRLAVCRIVDALALELDASDPDVAAALRWLAESAQLSAIACEHGQALMHRVAENVALLTSSPITEALCLGPLPREESTAP